MVTITARLHVSLARDAPIGLIIQLDYPDGEWAEIDGQRLVWAAGGKLYSGTIGSRGLVCETELYDFNPMKFRLIKVPY